MISTGGLAGLRFSSSTARRQRLGTLLSVAVMLVAVCLLIPHLALPLALVPFFLPLYFVLLALLSAATAALFLIRARVEKDVALALLAAVYAAAVPLLIVAAVSLPGSVTSRGVTRAGLTVAGYCLVIWRLLLPLGFLGFSFASRRRMTMPIWLPSAIVVGVTTLATIVISVMPGWLPDLIRAGQFTMFHQMVCTVATVLDILAVVTLVRLRSPTTIERWAVVAATAAVLEALLSSHLAERFSVGWYSSRAFGAIGAAVMFSAVAARAVRVAHSIHDKLRAEESLRTLAETIPQIVWTARPSGAIDWSNRRWLDYTGLTEASSRVAWRESLHQGDLAALVRRWPQLLADGTGFEVEQRIRDRHGGFRWFLTRVEPVRDESGRVVRWYGTSTDVDEQRRQAKRLQELYTREHRIAVSLQTAFLPANFPPSPGLGFSHVYRPASQEEDVGGDWYDAFRVGERRIAVCIGDVSGHGLEAAVRMLRVRELVRAAAFDDAAPSVVLERAATALEADDPEHLVSALYGVFDCARGTFTYASAGHPPPALLRDGGAHVLACGGIPLGIELGPSYENHALALREGDVVALYTDGLTESHRDPIEGERRLLAVLESGIVDAGALAAELVPAAQLDDVAVATIAIGPLGAATGPRRDWHFHAAEARLARGARASCALYLTACGMSEDELAWAELALGELLGNVVRYAPGPVDIEVSWRDGSPRLTISDRGVAGVPDLDRISPHAHAESGRGFTMLGELGMRPLVRPRAGGGTEVIVTLLCPSLAL